MAARAGGGAVGAALRGEGPLAMRLPLLTPKLIVPNTGQLALELDGAYFEWQRASASAAPHVLEDRFGSLLPQSLIGAPREAMFEALCDVVAQSLMSGPPPKTATGMVLLWHAENFMRRRHLSTFYVDSTPNEGEYPRDRARTRGQAANVWMSLPRTTAALRLLLAWSSNELRKRAAGKPVVLYRGTRSNLSSVPRRLAVVPGWQAMVPFRALSSWTNRRKDAERFAGVDGTVLRARVRPGLLAMSPGFAEGEVLLFPARFDLDSPRVRGLNELRLTASRA